MLNKFAAMGNDKLLIKHLCMQTYEKLLVSFIKD